MFKNNKISKCLKFIIFILLLFISVSAYAETLIGNHNSKIFHYSNCRYVQKMNDDSIIYFNSYYDAISAGYRQCKYCKLHNPSTDTSYSKTYSHSSNNNSSFKINNMQPKKDEFPVIESITFEKARDYYLITSWSVLLLYYVYRTILKKHRFHFSDLGLILFAPIMLVVWLLMLPLALFEKLTDKNK